MQINDAIKKVSAPALQQFLDANTGEVYTAIELTEKGFPRARRMNLPTSHKLDINKTRLYGAPKALTQIRAAVVNKKA